MYARTSVLVVSALARVSPAVFAADPAAPTTLAPPPAEVVAAPVPAPVPAPVAEPPAAIPTPTAPVPVPAVAPAPVSARTLAPSVAPLGIENPTASLRLGLLLQPQYLSAGETTYTGTGQNLYLRRARIIVGGTLLGAVDYFFDADYPNLYRGEAASGTPTVKYTPRLNVQDAFLTYRPLRTLFMVDAGFFLPPMAHNTLQSAGTLFSWDFFEYSYQHDQAFGTQSPITTAVGRDAGVQVRGLLFGGHLEYRLGAFQGLRGPKTPTATGAQNHFRVTGRLQINLLDPEPGFFYAGTYLGTRRILSIGGSYDFQGSLTKDYLYLAADAFIDLPVGPGIVTAQVNVAHWNGHMFIPMTTVLGGVGIVLEDQTAVMGEAGFSFFGPRLGPVARVEHIKGPGLPAQDRYGGGIVFWPYGHNFNVKAFYARIVQAQPPNSAPVHDTNQVVVQTQLYFF